MNDYLRKVNETEQFIKFPSPIKDDKDSYGKEVEPLRGYIFTPRKMTTIQDQQLTQVISELGRLRQQDSYEFEISQGYWVRFISKKESSKGL